MTVAHPLSSPVFTTTGRSAPGYAADIETPCGAPAAPPEANATMAPAPPGAALPETILRFLLAERLLHWAIAIPFLGCFLSALVLLLVFNHNPTGAYRPVFAWMHRGSGAGLILCPSLVLLASGRQLRIHFYNVRQAWVWRLDDIKWLALMGPAALFQRIALPDQGKFNAAEKLNFMMVMVFPPLFIATGLLIWFPDHTSLGAFGAWLIHCALAAVATPLLIGHITMATVNPSTRVGLMGMISGFVSREWAAHHYAHWFREQFPHLTDHRTPAADEAPGLAANTRAVEAPVAEPASASEEQAQPDVPGTDDAGLEAARTTSAPALAAPYCIGGSRQE